MANENKIADSSISKNYQGLLFSSSNQKTPFFAMASRNGARYTLNSDFSCSQEYELPDAKQPAISERASVTAPEALTIVRTQTANTTQIFHYKYGATYKALSESGRLAKDAISLTAGLENPIQNELDFQRAQHMKILARDLEKTFLTGTYARASTASTPGKTRGMIELCTNCTKVDAASKNLEIDMIDELLIKMFNSGALFTNPVFFCSAKMKQRITNIFKKEQSFVQDPSRSIAGVALSSIVTSQGYIDLVDDVFMPDDSLLLADMKYVAPVFQIIPGMGTIITDTLAKTGASITEQLYAQIGLDHGPAFMHGIISGINLAAVEKAMVGFSEVGKSAVSK